jgi:hypothetical protein
VQFLGAGVEEMVNREVRRKEAGATLVRGVLHPQSGMVLLDASGRKVLDLWPGPNDVSHLAPGVYFVRPARDRAQAQFRFLRKVVITE